MLINDSGKLFGRFNVIDFSVLSLAVLATAGVLLVQSGLYRTSGQVIKGEGDIEYTIYIRNVKTLKPKLFVPKHKLSITIRNQPRGSVEIVGVKNQPRRNSFMGPDGELKTLQDPADPYGYDTLVTLKDHATFTNDGYVTEGIKVKIGLPIEVEGHDYRVTGVIVDVHEENTAQPVVTPKAS
jgi:hypothetical protein